MSLRCVYQEVKEHALSAECTDQFRQIPIDDKYNWVFACEFSIISKSSTEKYKLIIQANILFLVKRGELPVIETKN